LITMQRASELTKQTPKYLRQSLLGEECPQNLIVGDANWIGRAIDVEVGDSILLPSDIAVEGSCMGVVCNTSQRTVVTAETAGIGTVADSNGWCSYVRVMRKGYVGRAMFRHDAEVGDE